MLHAATLSRLRLSHHARLLGALCALGVLVTSAACGSSSDAIGDGGAAVPSSGEAGRIYVTVAKEDSVVVIDEPSHTVHGKIAVGKGPAIILATPDKAQLYTANWADNTVSAITIATEKVVSIPTPGRPYVIAMAPAGDFVYAGLASNKVLVIDTATRQVARMIPTSALPASIIVSRDGKTLYIATIQGTLEALTAATGAQAWDPITVGSAPAWITISPDGKKLYTLNFLSDDVSVVDIASWKVTATVSTGKGSQAIIGNVTPDSAFLYVTNYGTGNMLAIDTSTNMIASTYPLDGRPVGVNFNTDGSRVYVVDFGPKSLSMPADTTFLLTGSFKTTDPGQVSVFDTATGKLVGSKLTVGAGPTSVVFIPK